MPASSRNQTSASGFDHALKSRADIGNSIVNTKYDSDCQVHLDIKKNVIKKEKRCLMCDMTTPDKLSSFYLMVPILLSHNVKKQNDLPIATSNAIVSILFE